ncbi:hypothetical protein [Bacillus sp. Y1]|nr:hypothetical protein [Bacillus sp. Y1]
MEECPKCGNKKIKEVGEMAISFERSVSTGKLLKKDNWGTSIWWMYICKCGWKSEQFTE